MTNPDRYNRRYQKARAELKKVATHCTICRYPIDLQLTYPHPLSFSADHIIPKSKLPPGDDRHWHISNMRPTHLRCNESRGNKPHGLNTSRNW
jgi:5-methylcytosine-specific restriction endonuclease McrA